ncbi:MAG: hypothetical protein CSA81_06780 [Acidobacteria bacterium]|nr:MAG: hypothetical protein CSA81_06780 [Acidobacteriota bacterium]PIE90629.1 MAG: hypothetical protein CR997_05150 [Acidobacteriota bacterium]
MSDYGTVSLLDAYLHILGHPVFFFMLGACIGSFMNVVFYRYPLNRSVVSPGSACPSCKKAIAFYDNIPILAWIILKGCCRHCHLKISPIYPAVELAFAVCFTLANCVSQSSLAMSFTIAFLSSSALSVAYLLKKCGRAPWYLWLVACGSFSYFCFQILVG